MSSDKKCSKKQTMIKNAVHSFGKLVLAWKSDVRQLELLAIALQKLLSLAESVKRCTTENLITKKYRFLFHFENVQVRIMNKLCENMEDLFKQLKYFWKRLGDITAAMIKAALESAKIVIDEYPLEIFNKNNGHIFNPDHILEIQTLQSFYSLEFNRKKQSFKTLWTIDQNYSSQSKIGDNNETIALYSRVLSLFIESWSDSCHLSYIDTSHVDSFLLQHNIPLNETQDDQLQASR